MCVRLVLLAHAAVFHILLHKLHEAWPPELRGNKLVSFQVVRVTCSFVVMTADKDRVMKGVLWENINMSFVCEDVVIILPVQETGSEDSGDVLQG